MAFIAAGSDICKTPCLLMNVGISEATRLTPAALIPASQTADFQRESDSRETWWTSDGLKFQESFQKARAGVWFIKKIIKMPLKPNGSPEKLRRPLFNKIQAISVTFQPFFYRLAIFGTLVLSHGPYLLLNIPYGGVLHWLNDCELRRSWSSCKDEASITVTDTEVRC